MGWGEKPWRQRERERERERETMRSREWEQAGEAEPGVAKNRVTLPCKRLNPVKQCPLEPHSRPHSDRSLLPPLQPQPTTTPYTAPLPTATPSRSPPFFIPHHPFANFRPSHRPTALYHSSLHTSANFLPAANCHPKPFLALFHPASPLRQLLPPHRRGATPSRYPLPPLAPHLCKLPLACTTTRPVSVPLRPAPAPIREGRSGLPQGRAPAPIAPNTHNRPIAPRTRTKKERHPLPDAAPWNGCAAYSRSSPVSSATGGS